MASANRLQNIFRVRAALDHPEPASPDFDQIFRVAIAEEQDMRNEMSNSGVAWAVSTVTVNYQPGRDSYALNVTDFGKPLFVNRVTNNCLAPFIPVPFQDVDELQYGTILASFYNGCGLPFPYLDNTTTLEKMAFYRSEDEASQPMVKIQPMPKCSAEYIIHYQPGLRGDADPLTADVTLPEFVELLRLRQAMALLPYSKWYTDEPENRLKRQELAVAFQYQMQRKEQAYHEYIATITKGRTVILEDWSD